LIKIQKSVYDPPSPSDGKRVLVMTLWPRGVSKDKVDVWAKELGTPRELIRLWKTGKVTWEEFATRYRESLRGKEEAIRRIAFESESGTVTLLCTERDPTRCHRSLLKDSVEGLTPPAPRRGAT
jgi:uncharacterized protein YeaO (DUF488 family)